MKKNRVAVTGCSPPVTRWQPTAVVIADSDQMGTTSALTVSLRRCDYRRLGLTTRATGYSGLWGGVVPDALTVLVRLLASLHDDDGNVAGRACTKAPRRVWITRLDGYAPSRAYFGRRSEIGTGPVPQRLWRSRRSP